MPGERWRCGDCGYEPVGTGRPSILTCPRCKGDFTWEPVQPTTATGEGSDDQLTIDISNLDRPLERGDLLRIEHRNGTRVLVQVLHIEEGEEAHRG